MSRSSHLTKPQYVSPPSTEQNGLTLGPNLISKPVPPVMPPAPTVSQTPTTTKA